MNEHTLKRSDGSSKKDSDEGGIEFEGVYIDDDPTASMVVMRRFLFYNDDTHVAPQVRAPTFKVEKTSCLANGDTISNNGLNPDNSVTTKSNKSARRVTLFEGKT